MRVDFPLLSKLVIGKESFIKGENVVIESMILRKDYEVDVPQLMDVSFADTLFQDIILKMFFDTHKNMNITLFKQNTF